VFAAAARLPTARLQQPSARALSTSSARAAPAAFVWKVDDPYTGEIVAEVPQLSEAEASQRVAEADAAYRKWRTSTLTSRIQLLTKSDEAPATCRQAQRVEVARGRALTLMRCCVNLRVAQVVR